MTSKHNENNVTEDNKVRKMSRTPTKLKSKILAEILLPNSFIPKIAKKYNLSSTTLYGWRSYHRKLNCESKISDTKNNFIELLPEKELSNKSLPLLLPTSKSKNPKLSEISLIFNDISLSLKGNINTSSLIKILSALEESSC